MKRDYRRRRIQRLDDRCQRRDRGYLRWNANADTNGEPQCDPYSDGNAHSYGDSHRIGTFSDTHVHAWQPVHDNADRRQHRARHDRHRQSRG